MISLGSMRLEAGDDARVSEHVMKTHRRLGVVSLRVQKNAV
jgi:hypothetical protein